MERKFESELGKSIATGDTKHSKKAFVAVAAAVTCAVMFGSAAFLMPVLAADPVQLNKPVFWVEVNDDTQYDYIIFDEFGDPDVLHYSELTAPTQFEVKRSMNLKVTDFDQPNSLDAGSRYNKLVYSMGVNVQSLDHLTSWDKVVGTLSFPYAVVGTEAEIEYSPSVLVNGIVATEDDILDYWYDGEDICVTVTLGSYTIVVSDPVTGAETTVLMTVDSGDLVSIQLMVKVPYYKDIVDDYGEEIDGAVDLLGLDEEAFSGLDDYQP